MRGAARNGKREDVRGAARNGKREDVRGAARSGRGAAPAGGRAGGITVVIPCYKSALYLENTVEELLRAVKAWVILINDGSPDETFSVIENLCLRHPGTVTGIDLAENAGQAQAKMASLGWIRGGITVFMDDDGQHDPRQIRRLVRKLQSGYDIVYARFPELEESPFRRAASGAMDFLLWITTRKPPGLRVTSFFAISEAALEELKSYHSRHPFIGGWLFLKGYRASSVPVPHRKRETGRSGYTMKKLFKRALELMVLYRLPVPKNAPPAFRIRRIVGTFDEKWAE